MAIEYADSNVWIALLQGEPLGEDVRGYLRELRQGRNSLITSVLTLTEISIRAHRTGQPARSDEHIMRLNALAMVVQLTPDVAKTAARLEAKYGTKESGYGPKLTRWDALHLSTAITYKCSRFLTLDEQLFAINFASESYMPHIVKPIPLQSGLSFDVAGTSPLSP
jgi:predicted nucleic acid-binding protein